MYKTINLGILAEGLEVLDTLLEGLNAAAHLLLALNERRLGAAKDLAISVKLLHLLLSSLEISLELDGLEALDNLTALVGHTIDCTVDGVLVDLGGGDLTLKLLESHLCDLEPLVVLLLGGLGSLDLSSELVPQLDVVDGIRGLALLDQNLRENVLVEVGDSTRSVTNADDITRELLVAGQVGEVSRIECANVELASLTCGLCSCGLSGSTLRKGESGVACAALKVLHRNRALITLNASLKEGRRWGRGDVDGLLELL